MALSAYATGFFTSLSLIVAIGAQNAFVMRQGLRGEHIFAVCLTCALSDAALIAAGVIGFRQINAVLPWLDPAMRYGGAAFLLLYGARSLRSAMTSSAALTAEGAKLSSPTRTLAACLALTWLNPHVYLDTIGLLGAISTRFPGREAAFAGGAMTGSFLFFFSLGYGSTALRSVFSKPSSWRVLEALVAFTMWTIGLRLLALI